MNNWIYAGVLKRKFDLSTDQVYSILDYLENDGVLMKFYELYCNQCQRLSGHVSVFNEIPETFTCETCGTQLIGLENSIIVYKVIKDA